MDNLGLGIFILVELIIVGTAIIVLHKNHKLSKSNRGLLEVKKWYQIAMTDDLTGLQSHRAYTQHIEKLRSFGRGCVPIGILVFDIDNFKAVNDIKGHLAGDEVLKKVAVMLTDVFAGKENSLYRIGGDEFAIIAESASEQEIISRFLELSKREASEGVRLSKGYALIFGNKSFKQAFAEADEMLYADKSAAKKKVLKI